MKKAYKKRNRNINMGFAGYVVLAIGIILVVFTIFMPLLPLMISPLGFEISLTNVGILLIIAGLIVAYLGI